MNVDSWWNKPWPLGGLLFGLLSLALAIIGTFSGRAYGRGSRVNRAEDPSKYWRTLIVEYMGAAFLIWYWLYGLPR